MLVVLRKGASIIFIAFVSAFGAIGTTDGGEPPKGESSVVIQQRLIDTGNNDETTVIEVVVHNKGSQPVEDVVIHGVIPKGHQLRSTVPEMEKIDDQCLWKMGQIDAGEMQKLRLQFVPSADSTAADLKVDLKATFRSAAVSVLETPAKQAAPKVSVLVPDNVVAGVPAPITIQVTNRSNRPCRSAILQATLGAGLIHANGKELEKDLGPLEIDETKTVRLEVIPTKSGELRGKVRVRSEGSAWMAQEFTLSSHEMRLSVAAIAPATCSLKALAPITIRVRNDGADAAKRVRCLMRLPRGFSFHSAVGGTHIPEENCVIFDLGEMSPGEGRDLRLTGFAAMPGEQRISAVLSSNSGDRQSHSVSVQVLDAVLKPPASEGRNP